MIFTINHNLHVVILVLFLVFIFIFSNSIYTEIVTIPHPNYLLKLNDKYSRTVFSRLNLHVIIRVGFGKTTFDNYEIKIIYIRYILCNFIS